MSYRIWAVILITTLSAVAASAAPPSDPRFFGTYCGSADVEHCVTIKVKLWPGGPVVYERRECQTIRLRDIRAQLTHLLTSKGGLVTGQGSAQADGRAVEFVAAGVVRSAGRARGSATVRGLDPAHGRIELSADGLELLIRAYGKSIKIRKDACGNHPPQVAINFPSNNAVIPFGTTQLLSAAVSDADDASFPKERLRFISNRDGLLGTGQIVFSNFPLSPGAHAITFTATDSGGLSASATVNVTVENRAPDVPIIWKPLATDSIVATGPVVLEGEAFDREQGMLDSQALRWTSKIAGGPSVFLGAGRRVTTTFAEPRTYVLRLTARDNVGAETHVERTITVLPFAGNTPPRVSIVIPDQLGSRGEVAAALVQGTVDFVGTANDSEDAFSALNLIWRAEPIDPAGPAIEFGAGTTAASVNLTASGSHTYYRVTLRAKDTGGLIGQSSIKLLILARQIE